MKERGIIFNAEMVRAILDGRKTQTRRIIDWRRTRPTEIAERDDGSKWPWSEDCENGGDYWHDCPFGQPGDRLWVRETFAALEPGSYEQVKPQQGYCQDLRYSATDRLANSSIDIRGYKWIPSLHMPRWASRIMLEITGVRVERLQDISEEDAEAEGIDMEALADAQDCYDCIADHNFTGRPTSAGHFSYLWQSIYGAESWQANPWVWVVEFRVIENRT